jgi:hypothetical protein
MQGDAMMRKRSGQILLNSLPISPLGEERKYVEKESPGSSGEYSCQRKEMSVRMFCICVDLSPESSGNFPYIVKNSQAGQSGYARIMQQTSSRSLQPFAVSGKPANPLKHGPDIRQVGNERQNNYSVVFSLEFPPKKQPLPAAVLRGTGSGRRHLTIFGFSRHCVSPAWSLKDNDSSPGGSTPPSAYFLRKHCIGQQVSQCTFSVFTDLRERVPERLNL